jgi:hypothetical protein
MFVPEEAGSENQAPVGGRSVLVFLKVRPQFLNRPAAIYSYGV